MKTIHELKIWPGYFHQVRCGRMKFQLRRNDRDFKVGDELLLREWNPPPEVHLYGMAPIEIYTGRELLVRVDYIMEAVDIARLMEDIPDFVIMSISHVN